MDTQKDIFSIELQRLARSEVKFFQECEVQTNQISDRVARLEEALEEMQRAPPSSRQQCWKKLMEGRDMEGRPDSEPTSLLMNSNLAQEVVLLVEATSSHIYSELRETLFKERETNDFGLLIAEACTTANNLSQDFMAFRESCTERLSVLEKASKRTDQQCTQITTLLDIFDARLRDVDGRLLGSCNNLPEVALTKSDHETSDTGCLELFANPVEPEGKEPQLCHATTFIKTSAAAGGGALGTVLGGAAENGSSSASYESQVAALLSNNAAAIESSTTQEEEEEAAFQETPTLEPGPITELDDHLPVSPACERPGS